MGKKLPYLWELFFSWVLFCTFYCTFFWRCSDNSI